MLAVYLGDRLGLYRALADETSLTSTQLAAATDTHERYVREWLEQQAASAILAVENASAPASDRRYACPRVTTRRSRRVEPQPDRAHRAARRRLHGPARRGARGLSHRRRRALRRLRRRPSRGPGSVHPSHVREPARHRVAAERSSRSTPACGPIRRHARPTWPAGRAARRSRARAYPNVHVDGIDSDRASIEAAREHLANSGLEDRVAFHARRCRGPA